MLDSFTEGDEVEKQEKEDRDKDYLSKSLSKKKSILQMASESDEIQSSDSTNSLV